MDFWLSVTLTSLCLLKLESISNSLPIFFFNPSAMVIEIRESPKEAAKNYISWYSNLSI